MAPQHDSTARVAYKPIDTGCPWQCLKNALNCPACRCDNSNVCLGFIWNAASAACLYRGGVDALATRSFFVLPSTVDMDSLAWATPGSSGAVNGTPGVASCSVVVSVNGSAGVLQGGDNSTVGGGQTNGTSGNNTMQAPEKGALPGFPQEGSLPSLPGQGALPAAPSPVGNGTTNSTMNTTGTGNTTLLSGGNTTGSSNTGV